MTTSTSNPLSEFFTRDIHRNINGVVKAEQHDSEVRRQELDEYVITNELDKHFRSFYDYFNNTAAGSKNGVWISGFFGSGKSHFLKMLGYLLSNSQDVAGKKPLDFFKDKISDPMLLAEMNRPLQYDLEMALFNIDSKARSDNKKNKNTILSVFWRVFDDLRGYYGEAPHIAHMEAYLDQEGMLESFQHSFERIKGDSWQSKRRGYAFMASAIAQALQEVTGQSEAEAKATLKTLKETVEQRSVESFAKDIASYLHTEPGQKEKRLVFLVDEVGQYIGDDAHLMLNLQTVVEDLNIHCAGKAWVVVTSQEDIDSILHHVSQSRRNDFSKIQGRFHTPLSLSSANTDEVIKKRLLTKKTAASESLTAFYGEQQANLSNLITFTQDTAFFPRYKGSEDFVNTYPFLPYQFTLLQEVLRSVRESGSSGRHMAEGERSMLDMFQHTLKKIDQQQMGVLVPFYHFYASIHGFLDHTIRRVFEQAQHNERLEHPFDIQLLKILFMVRWVDKFKPNQDNLLTLMIDHVDVDKSALRKQVQDSLERLEQQTLVQRNGDAYYFLTNEQQEIMRTIKALPVDPMEVTQKLSNMMWGKLLLDKQLKYDDRHSYDFQRKLDEHEASSKKNAALALHIMTPAAQNTTTYQEDTECQAYTQDMRTALVRLPQDKGLYRQVEHILQTEQYFVRHGASEGSTHTKRLRKQLNEDKFQREKEVMERFEQLILEADVFAGGDKLANIERKKVSALCLGALSSLVESVYTKLGLVGRHYASEADVDAVFTTHDKHMLPDHDGNAPARSSMLQWCDEQQEIRRQTIVMDMLLTQFSSRPFGWAELDTLGILAELVNSGKLELLQHQERLTPSKGISKQLRSGSGRKSFVIRLQRQVSAALINTARELFRESSEGKSAASEPEALFQQFQNLLARQQEELQGFLQRSNADYPFHESLQTFGKLFKTLTGCNVHQDFFEALKKHEEAYEDYQDSIVDLRSFYNHQQEVFDKNKALLSQLAPEMVHVQDPTLQANYTKAKDIIQTRDHRVVKNLSSVSLFLEPVTQHLDTLRTQHIQDLQSRIDASLAGIQATYATDDALLKPHWQKWHDLHHEVTEARSIDSILARRSRIESLEQGVHNAVKQDLQKQKDEAPTGTSPAQSPPLKPKLKPVEIVYPAQVAKVSLIEDENDVQQYLDDLGIALRQHLRANKRVQLK